MHHSYCVSLRYMQAAERDINIPIPSVRLSVRLSVQFRYCMDMIAHIVQLFPICVRNITLVFVALPPIQNFKGTPPAGIRKICDLRPKSPFISEMVRCRAIVTMDN